MSLYESTNKYTPVRFNKNDKPEFFKELNKRVNNYFKENDISKHANSSMVFKTFFMIGLYLIPYFLMITGVVSSFWMVLLMWILMGFGKTGIGTSIMHDAIHGAYTKDAKLNRRIGYIINLVGGYHTNWKIQHNVLHHSFTNIHDYDEDIDKKIIRFSPTQERKGYFRFQILYAPLLYAILTLYWFVGKDFEKLVQYHKLGLLKDQKETFLSAFIKILISKTLYSILFIVLPIMLIDLPWQQVILGFLVMHAISGMSLALIFQAAHVVEGTDFFKVDENNSVESNWAIHQLRTTANFAKGNVPFGWFIGGLNHQIEHHLFPHICHVHYPKISEIIKSTAHEYGINYIEHKTFGGALISHFKLLHELGTGKYDKNLQLELAAA